MSGNEAQQSKITKIELVAALQKLVSAQSLLSENEDLLLHNVWNGLHFTRTKHICNGQTPTNQRHKSTNKKLKCTQRTNGILPPCLNNGDLKTWIMQKFELWIGLFATY